MDQGYFICDIDGVLLDIVSPACSIINKDFGMNLTPRDITTWDWEYCLSFPADYWTSFWQQLWETPSQPYKNANNFLGLLRGMGFKPVGLSTRPRSWNGLNPSGIARKSARRDNEALDLDCIIYVDNHESKAKTASAVWSGARYSIEDNPKNARDLGALTNLSRSLLLTRPWNATCIDVNNNWMRVDNYAHVIQELLQGGLVK